MLKILIVKKRARVTDFETRFVVGFAGGLGG
jgi:hypothetical protein